MIIIIITVTIRVDLFWKLFSKSQWVNNILSIRTFLRLWWFLKPNFDWFCLKELMKFGQFVFFSCSSSPGAGSSYQGTWGGGDYSTYPTVRLVQLVQLCKSIAHCTRARDPGGGEHITTFLHIHTTPTLKVVLRSLDIAIYPNTFWSPTS